MTDAEIIAELQKRSQDTDEFDNHQDAAENLVIFLGKFVPKENKEELSDLLEKYGYTASALGQKMMMIDEEMAEEE